MIEFIKNLATLIVEAPTITTIGNEIDGHSLHWKGRGRHKNRSAHVNRTPGQLATVLKHGARAIRTAKANRAPYSLDITVEPKGAQS